MESRRNSTRDWLLKREEANRRRFSMRRRASRGVREGRRGYG
jgi:hypothetical protein